MYSLGVTDYGESGFKSIALADMDVGLYLVSSGIEKLDPDKGSFCAVLPEMRLIVDISSRAAWCWIAQNYPFERFFFHYCISISLESHGSVRFYQYHCTRGCARHALFQMVARTTLQQ
jgi:hypothetical protein